MFCQREAAETAIYLAEVAGRERGERDFRSRVDEQNALHNDGLPRTKWEWMAFIAQQTNWISGASAEMPSMLNVANPAGGPDGDGDGLPDAWETLNFGSTTNGAAGDVDGDGFSNLDEYISDTQPTNGVSYLEVNNLSNAAARALFFLAASNRVYDLQTAPYAGYTGVWNSLLVLTSQVAGPVMASDTNAPTTGAVYRIGVRLP